MESNYLTSRTYTTPTCSLIVAPPQLSNPTKEQQDLCLPDFSLQLADLDRGEQQITVEGGRHQLNFLHQMVGQYITDLVAKFPLSIENARIDQVQAGVDLDPPTSQQVVDSSQFVEDRQLDPRSDEHSQRSGIIKNLPGLRSDLSRSAHPADPKDLNLSPKSPISKLFGRWNQPNDLQKSAAELLAGTNIHTQITDRSGSASSAAMNSASQNTSSVPTTPYLSRVPDRPLDHQLHLGNLATTASGETITLSAIGLFDLANVLDEYAAEKFAVASQSQPDTISQAALPSHRNQPQELDPTAASLSRLPSLPHISAKPAASQVYYQTRRSRPSFMSGIPWAIAAAFCVGVPSLLFDSHDNFLKDAVGKLNIPGLATAQKSITDTFSNKPVKSSSNSQSPTPAKTDTPTPWQSQPVEPPLVKTQSPVPGTTTTQDPRKIGVATLPTSIATGSGQQLPSPTGTTKPTTKPAAPTSITPNPLASSPVPTDLNSIGNSTGAAPTTATTPLPKKVSTTKPTGVKPPVTPKATTPQIGQLPISGTDPNPTGKVSVSKQQVLVPPSDLPPLINNSQIPFSPIGTVNEQPASGKIKPQSPKKKTPAKVKPTTTPSSSTTKPAKPTGTAVNSSAPIEPFTPVPKNPNLIDPNETNPQAVESPTPAIVPTKPLQSNNSGNNTGTESTDSGSLQETKRYFQSKWKPTKSQPNALQYVIQISGKSGIVRSITPQGEAATTYLQQSKVIKPGQKLISPAAAGSSDQKIWVLLQPDGSVETSAE